MLICLIGYYSLTHLGDKVTKNLSIMNQFSELKYHLSSSYFHNPLNIKQLKFEDFPKFKLF